MPIQTGSAEGRSSAGCGGLNYSVMYPAKYPEVIAVGATNQYDQLAWFSNDGPEVMVLAPGPDKAAARPGAREF